MSYLNVKSLKYMHSLENHSDSLSETTPNRIHFHTQAHTIPFQDMVCLG